MSSSYTLTFLFHCGLLLLQLKNASALVQRREILVVVHVIVRRVCEAAVLIIRRS